MDYDDVYMEVGRQTEQSEVPERCRNVIKELIDTEASYLTSLRDVLHGYQEPIRDQTHLPVKREDVDTIFGNTQELHNFSKRLLHLFEGSQKDIPGLAGIFLDCQADFKIYTTYCTNHPRSIKTLNSCQQQPTAAEFFYGCQLALGHMLPLSAFLLKPVQRILKYHLLLADLMKQYGKAVGTDDSTYTALRSAQKSMADVANYINAMMRREEARELLMMVQGWNPDVDAGSLVTEGIFRCQGAKVKRKVYLFENLVMMAKRHKDNVNYVYKGHILIANLYVSDSPAGTKDPTAFQLSSRDMKSDPKNNVILFAKDQDHKAKWLTQLRRMILEHHPNLPKEVLQKMRDTLEQGGSVSLPKDGERPPAPTATDAEAAAPKDKLQRNRATKAKRMPSKDKNANANHLDPSEGQEGVSPASSVTSFDDSAPGPTSLAEEIYSTVYSAEMYGTVGENIYGQLDDQLQFCASDDNESDHEDTSDGKKTPATPVSPKKESTSTTTDELIDNMDKPEVVVPMTSEYRLSHNERVSVAQLPGMARSYSRKSSIRNAMAASSTAPRRGSVANTWRTENRKAENRPASVSMIEDKKQKEVSRELTKGLVGRLVRKYTELTEDKPQQSVPDKTVARQHSSGVVLVAQNKQKSQSSVETSASAARNQMKWENAVPDVVIKLNAHQAKTKSQPADRSSVGVKRSKSSSSMSTSEEDPVLQRCGSITGIVVEGVTCPMAARKSSDSTYPSLYAVSAELRRDSWRIHRKLQLDRPTVVASGTKTVAYTDNVNMRQQTSSRRKSGTQNTAPVTAGRVRDLIAKFSVQPM